MLENLKEELNLKAIPSIVHLYVFEKMCCKKSPYETTISYSKAREVMGVQRIPSVHQNKFLKEMQSQGLIKISDKRNIELIEDIKREGVSIHHKIKAMIDSGLKQKDVCQELSMRKQNVSSYLKNPR